MVTNVHLSRVQKTQANCLLHKSFFDFFYQKSPRDLTFE